MSTASKIRPTILAAITGGSLVVGTLALGHAAYTYVGYREARARWSEISERLGEEGYDAAESDRRYVVVETHAESLHSSLEVAAGGLVLAVIAGWRRFRERQPAASAS